MEQSIINQIVHFELRSDLEEIGRQQDETPEYRAEGLIHSDPETWAIDVENGDTSYLYQSESEYETDCKLLGI